MSDTRAKQMSEREENEELQKKDGFYFRYLSTKFPDHFVCLFMLRSYSSPNLKIGHLLQMNGRRKILPAYTIFFN